MTFVDQLERRGVVPNLQKAASVVETERVGAFVAGDLPYPFGGDRPGAEPFAGAEALAQDGSAHFFERIAEDVGIDSDAEAHAGLCQETEIGQTVGEIALGR